MAISAARQRGLRGIVVPDTNASEAAVVEELEVIQVSLLVEAAAFFAGHLDIDPVPSRLQELFNTLAPTTTITPTCGARSWPNAHW